MSWGDLLDARCDRKDGVSPSRRSRARESRFASVGLRRWALGVACLEVLTVALVLGAPTPVSAEPIPQALIKERTERTPKRLSGIDVSERLEAPVPRALSFKDEEGLTVLYDEMVRGTLPTILTLNYSDCPMLCSLQLTALVNGMRQMDLVLGKDYQIVTVSLNPKELPGRSLKTKARYLEQYGRPDAERQGWKFLTGSEENIRTVAKALGFSYGYNEKRDEYVHPAAFVIATPEGVLARYIYGLEYHPKTLRLSLVEASEGKIGSSVDRLILYCFHYDASEGRYAPVAMNIMRASGSAGALALGGLLAGLWRNETRRKRSSAPPKIAT